MKSLTSYCYHFALAIIIQSGIVEKLHYKKLGKIKALLTQEHSGNRHRNILGLLT
jgi:hypothetical protein